MKKLLTLLAFVSISLTASFAFSYQYLYTCGPTWSSPSVDYYINNQGSADLTMNVLPGLMQNSFDEWNDPCCSRFEGNYLGTTSATAENNQGNIVLSWEESSWDPRFGSANQTIAVTLVAVTNNCDIVQAPILFNGVGFQFTANGGGTDVEAIATHEIGHLLGLDHSAIQQATMFASYVGGTGARSLHQDDTDGVCSLYTRACTCSQDSQCASDEKCINQQCERRPCPEIPCDTGLQCTNGQCVEPTCNSDADCSSGFICNSQSKCRSECPVCRTGCTSNNDCGSGAFCVDDGAGGNLCIVQCQQGGLCPGDSQCYNVDDGQGGNLEVCGSPNAQQSLCPDGYVCQLEDLEPNECEGTRDCGPGEACRRSGGVKRCVEDAACNNVACGNDETCIDGDCVPDSSNNEPGNNNPGNNDPGNNNTGGTNNNGTGGGGNGGGNADGDGDVVVIIEEPGGTSDGCSTTANPFESPALLVIALLGLFGIRRRRR